jgi:hypothetical protein
MSKDPACLFYINDWLTSTAEMDADCRGWYLNLLLHNYDKETLPNELEKLAVLCNVKFSEYQRFEQVFEQVLKQKFELLEDGRLSNQRTQSILKARELFKDKRSVAGKVSYLMRFFYNKYKKESKDSDIVDYVKSNLDSDIDTKNEHLIEQMFKHLLELYRNENEIENETVIDYENLRLYWNAEFEKTKIPSIQTMTDNRKKSVNAVLKKYSKEQIKEAIDKTKNSDFLTGRNGSDWKLSFDWFFKIPNFTKVIEGNYDKTASDTSKSIFG